MAQSSYIPGCAPTEHTFIPKRIFKLFGAPMLYCTTCKAYYPIREGSE